MTLEEILILFETANILGLVVIFFVFNISITVLEIVLDFILARKRRWQDTGANIVIYFLREVTEKTFIGSMGIICLLPFHYLTPISIPMNWWTWIISLLAADLTYYWMHRIEHEHRVLWALHSVHHSSEDYNLTTALRLSIIEGLVEWIFLIPMILIGFNPFQAIVSLVFVAQYQTWIHTEKIRKLGWLDEIFNTPSVHRVHHGSNEQYLDKNYGGILMIWDKLFGTFQREEEKVVYGLTKNIHTNNPLKINFIEFAYIWKDVKKCKTWYDRLRVIFGGLTWRPEYFKENSEVNKQEHIQMDS